MALIEKGIMIRRLITAWMLALVGSLLLPLMSTAALSGTTYDTPYTTTTSPATIAQHAASVEAVDYCSTGLQGMASGQTRSFLCLSRSLVAAKSPGVPKQITVIGSRTDTLAAKGWPGHNVLDVPTWTAKGNIKWLDSAIRRGDEIYLATDPAKHAAILDSLPTRPFSAFTDLELPYLQWRGYVQEGVRMVPKAP